jgi:hypothetical protein
MRSAVCTLLTTALAVVVNASVVFGQDRPLPNEPLNGVGDGNVAVQIGADYTRDVQYPLSGLDGNLWRIALVQIDVGLSSIADFELSGGLRDRLEITSMTPAVLSGLLRLSNPNSTSAFDDIIVGTHVRVLADADDRPGFGFRIATRLPNSKHPSGLGQNTTDFFGSLIAEHTMAGTRVNGNLGLGILGDPLEGNRRINSLLYGATLTRPLADRLEVVADLAGRTGPSEPGLEPRAIAKGGVAWTREATRLELDATWGLTERDGSIGAAVSARFAFHAFNR